MNANDQRKLDALRRFRAREGHLFLGATEPELYKWVVRVRVLWARRQLSPDLEHAVTELGLPLDAEAAEFEMRFKALMSFARHWKQAPGHGVLFDWLQKQRRLRKRGAMSPERERRLAALGVFDVPAHR